MNKVDGSSWWSLLRLWSLCFVINMVVFFRTPAISEPLSVLRLLFRDIFVPGVHGSNIPEVVVVMMVLGLVMTVALLVFSPRFWPTLLFFDRSANDGAPPAFHLRGPYYSGLVILSGAISLTATFAALFLLNFLRG